MQHRARTVRVDECVEQRSVLRAQGAGERRPQVAEPGLRVAADARRVRRRRARRRRRGSRPPRGRPSPAAVPSPAGGRGNDRSRDSRPSSARNRTGTSISTSTSRPPGRSAARTSASTRSGSATSCSDFDAQTRSTGPVPASRVQVGVDGPDPADRPQVKGPAPDPFEHLRGQVDRDHLGSAEPWASAACRPRFRRRGPRSGGAGCRRQRRRTQAKMSDHEACSTSASRSRGRPAGGRERGSGGARVPWDDRTAMRPRHTSCV